MSFESAIGTASCALIGAGLLAYGFYQRSKVRASQSWPQVMGTITKAEILLDRGPDSSGYSIVVLYDYTVDGVRHTGKRIGFSQRSTSRKKRAQERLDRYPVNSTVPVFFDPANPTDAVLVREYPDATLLTVLGSGLLVLAAVILVFGRG